MHLDANDFSGMDDGQRIAVLEAMKMEMRLSAPHDGVVKAVHCREGDVVERGKVLVEVDAG